MEHSIEKDSGNLQACQDSDNNNSVDNDLIILLYGQGLSSIMGSVVVAIICTFVLWPVTDKPTFSVWLVTLFTITSLRLSLIYKFQNRTSVSSNFTDWVWKYYLLTFLAGSTWGGLAFFLKFDWSMGYQLFIPLTLCGLVVGAVSSNAILLKNYAAFLFPVLIPLIMIMLTQGNKEYVSIGMLLVLYSLVLWAQAKSYHNNILKSLALRNENSGLVDILKKKNAVLEEEVITRKKIMTELYDSEKLSKSAFGNAAIPMALIDNCGFILKVNSAVCKFSGYCESELIGHSFNHLIHPDDIETNAKFCKALFTDEIDNYTLKSRLICRDDIVYWTQLTVSMVHDEEGNPDYMIAQVQNITEAHLLSEKLSYQARHDPLTGLINRYDFEERLTHVLDSSLDEGRTHVMCYIDMDQFKVVNDTCGHVAGDELLRQVALLMKKHVRKHDSLARLGGDEFGLLMENCSINEAQRVLSKIRHSIEDLKFAWESNIYSVTISIGMVEINEYTLNLTELLKQADSACFAAKDAGRNRIHVYHDDDEALRSRHGEMQWVSVINQALTKNNFEIYAQPIVPTDSENTSYQHFEVLLRMRCPDGRLVPPGAFLPAAERYNLAPQLDRWVVENVLQKLTRHSSLLDNLNQCAINLSGISLCDEAFLDFVTRIMRDTDVPASKICFEITETAAISNLSSATNFMYALKILGCHFALDDFGSGLSSFAYLKNLPIDYLKIDGMFVKDILVDPIDFAMVKSINEIGHVMGKKTIAEFVENNDIMNKLRDIGVDYAQGYGIGKPAPFLPD